MFIYVQVGAWRAWKGRVLCLDTARAEPAHYALENTYYYDTWTV